MHERRRRSSLFLTVLLLRLLLSKERGERQTATSLLLQFSLHRRVECFRIPWLPCLRRASALSRMNVLRLPLSECREVHREGEAGRRRRGLRHRGEAEAPGEEEERDNALSVSTVFPPVLRGALQAAVHVQQEEEEEDGRRLHHVVARVLFIVLALGIPYFVGRDIFVDANQTTARNRGSCGARV